MSHTRTHLKDLRCDLGDVLSKKNNSRKLAISLIDPFPEAGLREALTGHKLIETRLSG
jgi:hypothetical protein